MRLPRPSLFAIISLLILIALSIPVNFYIAHKRPNFNSRKAIFNHMLSTASPSWSDPVRWPSIPDELTESLGQPTLYSLRSFALFRSIEIRWAKDSKATGEYEFLQEYRFGTPLTVRSTQKYYSVRRVPQIAIREMEGSDQLIIPPTYHLPGLFINPIVYAIGPWIVLLLARRRMMRSIRRNRQAIRRSEGRCPECAYDLRGLNDLPTCPECGTAV